MTDQQALRAFGKRVKTLRLERGWTQETLAENGDLHENYVSRLENGHQEPGLLVIMRLARALGLSAAELLDGLASPRAPSR